MEPVCCVSGTSSDGEANGQTLVMRKKKTLPSEGTRLEREDLSGSTHVSPEVADNQSHQAGTWAKKKAKGPTQAVLSAQKRGEAPLA